MKILNAFVVFTALAASSALAQTVNFDDLKTGTPPAGWTATPTGSGNAKWEVVADDSAPSKPNVLKQSGEATYPVCISMAKRHWNGTTTRSKTRAKSASGPRPIA